jgi:hypothetical protein
MFAKKKSACSSVNIDAGGKMRSANRVVSFT